MTDLYRDAAEPEATAGFNFDDDLIGQALKNIYNKKFHPMTDIEETMFNHTWKTLNEATDKGFGMRPPTDPDHDFYEELKRNNAVFSAFKVHRAQNDMAAQLLDSNGKLKSFEQWAKDVQPIATHQMRHWLETEYSTAVKRAHQAADWRQFEREKEVLPNLKWVSSEGISIHPGADHKEFWGTVLPIDHPFWKAHRPGDRWGCNCSLTSTDEPCTTAGEIPSGGKDDEPADGLEGNPGRTGELFDDSHPYIKEAYEGAEKAVRKFVAEKTTTNEGRLQISKQADQTEVEENTRAAQAMLASFPKMKIEIREHVMEKGVKNPEYIINGKIADRKGIESESGITAGFRKAIKQGCEVVVIDLDMHMKEKTLKIRDLAKFIDWRKEDFSNGIIQECYVIYRGRAVKIGKSDMGREKIQGILKQLEPS